MTGTKTGTTTHPLFHDYQDEYGTTTHPLSGDDRDKDGDDDAPPLSQLQSKVF
jgi:hypothetical protein